MEHALAPTFSAAFLIKVDNSKKVRSSCNNRNDVDKNLRNVIHVGL